MTCARGAQMVIRAMAEGVFMEDILTFSRCDRLVVLRLPERALRQRVWASQSVREAYPDLKFPTVSR